LLTFDYSSRILTLIKDLVFADDANPDWVKEEEKVFSMEKLYRLYRIMNPLFVFRCVPFQFRPIPELQHLLSRAFCPLDEASLFAASLKCEPREEDHKK
jgi:hypothetical protein